MDEAERRALLELYEGALWDVEPGIRRASVEAAVCAGELRVEAWLAEAAGVYATGRHMIFTRGTLVVELWMVDDPTFSSLRLLVARFVEEDVDE